LTKSQRLSRIITGSHIHLISNPMVVQPTLDAQLPTQDGGNFSDIKMLLLSTREERLSKFKEILILKTETFKLPIRMEILTNNGTSSMLMNGKENQEKESSTKNSDSMLKDHSM
jgi:hypothetical protein